METNEVQAVRLGRFLTGLTMLKPPPDRNSLPAPPALSKAATPKATPKPRKPSSPLPQTTKSKPPHSSLSLPASREPRKYPDSETVDKSLIDTHGRKLGSHSLHIPLIPSGAFHEPHQKPPRKSPKTPQTPKGELPKPQSPPREPSQTPNIPQETLKKPSKISHTLKRITSPQTIEFHSGNPSVTKKENSKNAHLATEHMVVIRILFLVSALCFF